MILAGIRRTGRSPAGISFPPGGFPLFPLVAHPVVPATEQSAVLLGGLPALAPGLDVVDLAPGGRHVTGGVGTGPVPHLDGPPCGPGEQACAGCDLVASLGGEDGLVEGLG